MKIKKVLNQNAVLVYDGNREKVAIGKGIGFQKKQNDLLHPQDVERIFVMEAEQDKLQQLLSQIDERYFFASEEIIKQAEEILKEKLNEHIHIALADHIAFSVERLRDGIVIQNKLKREIEILYPEEFMIAQWAIKFLQEQFDMPFTTDEAAYISIHIHNARTGQISNNKSMKEITMISEVVELVAKELALDFSDMEMRLNYSRLVTHLRFAIDRLHQNKFHTMDEEVLAIIQKKYQISFQVAQKAARMLKQNFNVVIPADELGYITIHIERLRNQNIENQHG